MLKNTARKKEKISNPGNQEKDEHDDHPKGEEVFDDKQTTVLLSRVREQAPFEEESSSESMRKESTPVDYRNKKLELQLASVPVYLQACLKPKDYCASVVFREADVKFICSIDFIVATFFKLLSFLPKAKILKLNASAKKRTGEVSGERIFLGKELSFFIADTQCSMGLRMLRRS